jgi:DNA mismatch repair protein MutL
VDIEQTSLNLDVATVLLSSNFISVGPFLICASNNGLLIIHARRAKERLIYNQLMKNFMLQPLASQQLLFPMEKALSKQDRLLWEDNQLTLKRIGFDWNTNSSEFELTAIPAELTESTVIPCVDKIIECLQMDNLDKGEIAHTVLAQTAFASSISFQLSNESEALKEFVSSLLQTNDHTYTPKGKKIITELTNESIFQLF